MHIVGQQCSSVGGVTAGYRPIVAPGISKESGLSAYLAETALRPPLIRCEYRTVRGPGSQVRERTHHQWRIPFRSSRRGTRKSKLLRVKIVQAPRAASRRPLPPCSSRYMLTPRAPNLGRQSVARDPKGAEDTPGDDRPVSAGRVLTPSV